MKRAATFLRRVLPALMLVLGCDSSPVQAPKGEQVIDIVSGNEQGAQVGQRLSQPLVVAIADGAPVAGVRVAWTVTSGSGTLSADTTMSPASGVCEVWLTLGANPGPVIVTATLVGTTRQVIFTAEAVAAPPPPPPPPVPWPNEPANFTFVNDESFNALNENGWLEQQRQTIGDGLGVFLASDPLAPISPPSVLAFAYPVTFVAGREPGVAFYRLPSPVRETYFAFWWKPSDPWENNWDSNANKIAFMFPRNNGVEGDIFIMMYSTPAGYTIQVEPEYPVDTRRLPPNITATPVTLGVWHRIEWYLKNATTTSSRDGVTRWWLDGVLQGEYADVQTPDDGGVIEYQLAPTWGGVVGVKTEADTFWFDHAHISYP